MKHVYKMANWLLCWFVLFGSTVGFSQCTIQVTISGTTWGDEFNWQLTDGMSAVLLSGGQYGSGFNQTLSTTGTVGPYTLSFMGDGGTLCDNVPNYNVTVGGMQDIQGSPGVICGGTVVNLPLNLSCAPENPPNPTQDATTPTCVSGTNLLVSGSPAMDIEWYWQSSASGTSMDNIYSGPYNVFVNGTYYLRAYDVINGTWSTGAGSVVVSNIPNISAPPSPMADVNPVCANIGSNLSVNSAPVGLEYYWQGINATGSSTAFPATTTFLANTTNNYYVNAYEPATQCWSTSSGIAITVQDNVPAAPIVAQDVYNLCANSTEQFIEATGSPSSTILTQVTSFGTNLQNPNTLTVPVNVPALPLGANITSAFLTLTNVNSINGSWRSEIRIGLSGITTMAPTQISTLNSGGAITPNPYIINVLGLPTTGGTLNLLLTETFDDAGVIDCTFGEVTLTINYTAPSNVNWYDLASGGVLLSSGNQYDAVGSPVLPEPATNGVYAFYAASEDGLCESSTRTLITVNVNSVLVALNPSAVTCNNGNDGTFTISSVDCGSAPFTFSVDGDAFGPAPTDLSVGTHTVIVRDGTMEESAEYTIEILDAPAPSLATIDSYNNDQAVVSWTAGAFESQWNIEWGLAGFVPGTGAEVGSDVALTNSFTINGLDGNTDYDIYISANCGGATVPGEWTMTSVTTLCDPYGIPFAETFEDDSDTRDCWLNEQVVGAGNWTFATGSSGGVVLNAFEGTKNARFVSQSGAANPITKLKSPILLAENQDSVAVIFAYAQEVWAGDQNITRVYSRGSSTMSWNEEVVYTQSINAWTIDTLFIQVTTDSVELAFEGENNWGRANVIDHVQVYPCSVAPGTDGTSDVCRLDGTVDLNTVASPGAMYGEWYFPANPGVLNGSVVNVSTLAAGSYDFYYIIKTPCLDDTTMATVTIHPPSTAGDNGVLTTCMNQPINLLGGLDGTVDFGGVWTGPTGTVIPNGYFTTGQLPGQFNYTYVTSNGVCPNDTSEVLVNVQPCNWLSIDELAFEGITVYPNPSTGVFYISNEENGQDFTFEVLDLNGKVLVDTKSVIGSSKTELDLTSVQDGVYMIRLTSETGQKMIRIVKN